ncbi:SDR family oxidoreductase [Asticcacaulis sp. YBE204]|uniref:SDR family oxidoreductase n=1 Tax=Asticcacaulis sp. YBE204 TaxID=1282363 RepID=UPI0003C3DBD7|nr:SDR family oxidoreductase [Asticcacaulis sp. YBE204]ESQ80778.1 hypothetical protein AEYBE204_00215 [Asticcacaulis sp. YBE204]
MPKTFLILGAAGYVGSALSPYLRALGHTVVGCDIRPGEAARYDRFVQTRYQDLDDTVLTGCDIVLWFAGHSSVKISQDDPWGSFENNVFDLAHLFKRAAALSKPIIYASSASVLSSAEDTYSLVANEISANPYDAGKLAFDMLMPHLGVRAVGLRMATVSGWSPVMRWELAFNAMNRTAVEKGVVNVQNPSTFRSLLFLEDLARYVELLSDELILSPDFTPRTVALGSWSGTIGLLASEIADYWAVPLNFGSDSGTYSFVLNDREIRRAMPETSAFYQSLRQRCERFARENQWK